MSMIVQIPASDKDIIDALCKLPGTKRIDQSRFDGVECVRILVELAAASTAIAKITKDVAETVKSVEEIVETLRSIFRTGIERYRHDPDSDFTVTADGARYLSSDMPDTEIDNKLSELNALDDRFS